MLAMTVSIGRPRPVASCASVADLPMPGSPHSSTGRFAATISASASAWLLAAGSVRLARVAATKASASASGSGSVIFVVLIGAVGQEVEIRSAVVAGEVGDGLLAVLVARLHVGPGL